MAPIINITAPDGQIQIHVVRSEATLVMGTISRRFKIHKECADLLANIANINTSASIYAVEKRLSELYNYNMVYPTDIFLDIIKFIDPKTDEQRKELGTIFADHCDKFFTMPSSHGMKITYFHRIGIKL